MTCKDCVSNDVCAFHSAEFGGAETCVFFKNKADWEEAKHGEWVEKPCISNSDYTALHCSECDCGVDYKRRFCPNCGARMDGKRK